jgi:hypothetical protein
MGQTLPPATVLVCDNGPVPVASRMEWRFVVDALAHRGIPVVVLRLLPAPDLNVGKVRHLLLSQSRGLVGWCDDDVLWEPRVAQRLVRYLADYESPWACALQLTPNNEADVAGWTAPAFPSEQFGDLPDGVAPASRSSGHALFMDADAYDGHLATWDQPTGEDTSLTAQLGTGARLVAQGCRAWELAHPENRKWRPAS